MGDALRVAGFDPAACPIVDAVLEEEGDPEWGTQFDVLDASSARALVAALGTAYLDRPPPSRSSGGRTDELLATIEDAAVVRRALPVERGALTDRMAWRVVVLQGGRIGRTLVDAAPYVEESDGAWPRCATCGHAMTTVFQVDTADGPYAERFPGLYVVFACCAPDQLSAVVRYYRDPHVERRRKLAPPPTDRAGGRLGYLLSRGRRELVPPTWSALPRTARDAFEAPLDGMAGAELYEALAEIVAARQASDASAGGGIAPPACEACGGESSLVFSTTYLAGGEHAFELWACPCAPDRARLALRAIEPLA